MSTTSPVREVHSIPIIVPSVEPRQLPAVAPGRYVPLTPVIVPEREPVREFVEIRRFVGR